MQHEREMYAVERHKLASQLEQAVKESKDFSSLLRQRDEVGLLLSNVNKAGQIFCVVCLKLVLGVESRLGV